MVAKKPEADKVANITPFGLRMASDLRKRVFQSAKANGRSMNAEIVDLLEMYYPPVPSLDTLVKDVQRTIEAMREEPDQPDTRRELQGQLEGLRDWIGFHTKLKKAAAQKTGGRDGD